jgi:isopropylmalate/homocitrate/citramalate synthase
MSLAEMKEELRRLTPEERRELARALVELEAPEIEPRVREAQPSDPGVVQAMDAVFSKHSELLRRLAQ